jgi:hypothetical protein
MRKNDSICYLPDRQNILQCLEVVSNVLSGSSLFLRNVGLQFASKKSTTSTIFAMIQQLQDELETERQEKDELWEEVKTLKAQAQASQRDH